MADEPAREAYVSSVERISADMGRLVGIIEVMLTGDDDALLPFHFNEPHFERAAWSVGGMFIRMERDIYRCEEDCLPRDWRHPEMEDPAWNGVELFRSVLAGTCRRWGIPLGWLQSEDDGERWVGHAFPDNFPARGEHVFLPEEVARLRLAHRLTTIPRSGGGGARPIQDDDLEASDSFAFEQDQIHHVKRGQIRLEMFQRGWGKISEPNLRKMIHREARRRGVTPESKKRGRPRSGGNSH